MSTADGDVELLDTLDDALVVLRKIAQRPGYRRRLLEGLDLPGGPGTVRALRVVERTSDPAPSVGKLAEVLALDPSTASRVVDRCVGAGLLTRDPHPGDRRRTHLHLTTAGRELLDAASRNRRALLGEVTQGWETKDLQQLLELVRVLVEGFDRVEPAP